MNHYETLDETIKAIKADCEQQLTVMRDKLLAAEIEATMAKEQLREARNEARQAQNVATKLLTQFSTVAKVFEEAKAMALALTPATEAPKTLHGASISETSLEALGYNRMVEGS